MNEQLIVKNFGPIKDATVDFKKVTVFIGPTGGGKSTLAKLAAIFRDIDFYGSTMEYRKESFSNYSLDNYFISSSLFDWIQGENGYQMKTDLTQRQSIIVGGEKKGELSGEVVSNQRNAIVKKLLNELNFDEINSMIVNFSEDEKDKLRQRGNFLETSEILLRMKRNELSHPKPNYFPSNRTLLSSIEYSWAGLLRNDIGLPKDVLDFANNFSLSRKAVTELNVSFLRFKYIHQNGQDFIKVPESETLFRLYETASGIQSVTPLLVSLEHLSRRKEQAQSFIIEEPELNLYPTAQQGLLNWLVEKCTSGENDLTITTHSPYILSHLNLLLFAYQVAEKHPERADDVAKIVPRESWINSKDFAAYHVEGQKEGGVHSIVNPETGLISYNDLDALAGNSATEFDQLLDINAGLEVE